MFRRAFLILIVPFFIFSSLYAEKEKVIVAVTQLVAHPAIDAVREGIKDSLQEEGFIENVTMSWVYANAHGNSRTANQIARKFVGMNPDVIVAISTLSAQSCLSCLRDKKNIPLVFAAVTDPVTSCLIKNVHRPGGNVTGTVDEPVIENQIKLIRDTLNKSGYITVGILYNSGEVNSVYQVKKAKIAAQKYNIKIIAKAVDNSTKVLSAAQSMLSQIDAIYVPLDNTVASVLQSLVKLGLQNNLGKKIPIFASDPEGVRQGAIATIGFTHYEEGRSAGKIVADILNGKKPGDISVRSPPSSSLYLNINTAEKMGIHFKNDLLTSSGKEIIRFE